MVNDSPRETRVLSAVVSLVDRLLDDFDVVDLLTDLTERCADLLDVASAGFLLADPLQRLHLLAATSEQTREVELFQLQAEEGPCVECYRTGQPVLVADMRTEIERWPQFAPTALEAGFAAVHAVPMRAAGAVLGALGLFDTQPKELAEADRLVGQTLAHIACVAVLQEHPPTPETVLAAAARSPGGPRPGRAGQGISQRDARSVGGRRVRADALLQPHPWRAPHRRSRGG